MPTAYINTKRFEIVCDEFNKHTGTINGKDFVFDLEKLDENEYHLIYENKSFNVELIKADYQLKQLQLRINGVVNTVTLEDEFDQLLKSMGMDKASATATDNLKAPMPGLVLKILVSEGDEIKKGDALIILEAMKMENVIKAASDVRVKKIVCNQAKAVEKNQLLIEFE